MVGSGRNSVSSNFYVLVTCKYEKDPIKTAEKTWIHRFPQNESMEIFSGAQGQLNSYIVVGSGLTSNSFKLECMSLLPASMKIIR